ncbi:MULTISPECIES: MBL fold metallo-hydrolase [unclassified Bacillus (in: firmicutes)]|uniref:MBL fold metallo-hydrolase n=1 Tax=unclassified Bacillus (in: firmicutes) TaxID=185979 RepID=UPI0008EE83EE|nr:MULTISPECIES: MBL fold metallo-hydrolase [unclassified Bacillus (in: firmicutes)]SFH99478.1 Glyoxylase, beta-lactamase superfamily II [Bacillus sp. 71mf]SFS93364.1 Glyoxylase, beta-lactamase superfamily II [Bacillus sp. 103mf]
MIQYKDHYITIFQSAMYQTNSVVVETDELVLVIDPTWLPNEVNEIQNYVYKNKKDKDVYLLFTHSDFDHILGYGAFLYAKVIASKKLKDCPNKQSIIDSIRDFDDSYYLTREYEIKFPNVDISISKKYEELEIGDMKFHFYQAPGHTEDGIITVLEPLGIVIAGDYLSNIEFPYIYHNSDDYLSTLQKLESIIDKHDISLLIPGHGGFTKDQAEMKKRISESVHYILQTKQLLLEDKQEETYDLIKKYSYPKAMKKFHNYNLTLLKKERNV